MSQDRNRLERSISLLADGQHGIITRAQLVELGLGRRAIEHRLRSGRLYRIHHSVYAVGRPSLTARGRQLSAVLAYGPTAVLSHRSAAALWELLGRYPPRVVVTVPGTSRQQQQRIRVHRARSLADEDRTTVDGIPVTTVPRTLVDLAVGLRAGDLLRVVEQAERSGQLNLAAIQRLLDRGRGHRGARRLVAVLADYRGPVPIRSKLERRFLELVHTAGLPRPLVNSIVVGLEVDFFWPQGRLAVELDSRAFHLDLRSFERDRVRDAMLQRAGCRVLRVTHKRMSAAPADVIDDLRALGALADAG